MRVPVRMLLAVALALAYDQLQRPPDDTGELRFHWDSPKLFDRFLPGCMQLQQSAGEVRAIAEDGKSYVLDLNRCTAPWHGERPNLIDDEGAKIGSGESALARDGERVAVLADQRLYLHSEGQWTSRILRLTQEEMDPPVSRMLLDGTTLYIGTDMGEWGGALYSIALDAGPVIEVSASWPYGSSNIADLDRGPDGSIWATTGCIHGNGYGELYVRDRGMWQPVAKTIWTDEMRNGGTPKWLAIAEASNHAGDSPWAFPPTGFTALDFDDRGQPYLLTETYGVFRREADGSWKWITPGWPNWDANVTDLAIVGGKAVISSRAAGVIVVNLETLAARRVRLRD